VLQTAQLFADNNRDSRKWLRCHCTSYICNEPAEIYQWC